MIQRRRQLFIELLSPTSLSFYSNTELICLQVTVGNYCKWVPLQLAYAWYMDKQDTRGVETQSYGGKQVLISKELKGILDTSCLKI